MVEVVQVPIKQEADREGFSAASPSNHNQMASHVTSTSNNDSVLSAAVASIDESIDDIFDIIRLVKIRQKDAEGNVVDTRLWPGLLFSSQNELFQAVESSGMSAITKIGRSIKQQKKEGYKFSHGIAFLLGRQTIEDSILLLGEHMLESFDDHIDELLHSDEYKNNPEFMASVAIVKKLMFSSNEDDEQDSESQSDDGTVALNFDNTMPSPSSNNQASVAEVIAIDLEDDTPENLGVKDEKRKSDDKNDGSVSKKKTPAKSGAPQVQVSTVTPASGVGAVFPSNEDDGQDDESQTDDGTMSSPSSIDRASATEVITDNLGGRDKKRKSEGKNDGNVSKKKTPEGKSRGSQPSVVTPPPPQAKSDHHKNIAEDLHESRVKPHSVIKNEDAWKLLKENYGFICVDGKYVHPQSDKPVATSLMGLRKYLCEKGLPDNTQPLSEKEEVDIARWVRYAHVKGLEDGQEINPDDLGKPINKFEDVWSILKHKFRCRHSPSGGYKVPLTPDGEEVQVFPSDHDVYRHFAKFGIPCIPDDPGDRLNQKDRLSIELFFSTPWSLGVLNTFERVDGNVNSKRKRKAVSYSE